MFWLSASIPFRRNRKVRNSNTVHLGTDVARGHGSLPRKPRSGKVRPDLPG